MEPFYKVVVPGTFDPASHFYQKALTAKCHPEVESFLGLDNDAIARRYASKNGGSNARAVERVLSYKPEFLLWAGSDLFKVKDVSGHEQMVVVETNSCASGQKSMPAVAGRGAHNGFGVLIENCFAPRVASLDRTIGDLAVIFDKNLLEASGYAAAMADIMKEEVHLVELSSGGNSHVIWVDGVMHVQTKAEEWLPIRACFRYVTQTPWDRIPLHSKTLVINPIISCLAGGRNKTTAAIAYGHYNAALQAQGSSLQIRAPLTHYDVRKEDIPGLVLAMGGHAVIKVPCSNAGQGVYTITNAVELANFMSLPDQYDMYIVQALIGHRDWVPESITTLPKGSFFQVGSRPDSNGNKYVFDLRFMVTSSPSGFKPVAIYARKARAPLKSTLQGCEDSWVMLGTNLSVHTTPGRKDYKAWATETERLVLMDEDNFESLGLSIDDLIDAYVQTVLSVVAIDRLCKRSMPCSLPATEQESPPPPQPHVATQRRRGSTLQSISRELRRTFDSDLFKNIMRDTVLYSQIMLGSVLR